MNNHLKKEAGRFEPSQMTSVMLLPLLFLVVVHVHAHPQRERHLTFLPVVLIHEAGSY